MRHWQIAAGVLVIAAYAGLSHWLMLHAGTAPWAIAAIFGPLLAALAGVAWRRRHWPTVVFCGALLAVLAAVVAHGGVDDLNRLYVLQHIGIHFVLGGSFALSMRHGQTPLITAMAERVHREMTPAMRVYTRKLTGIWTLYFAGMVVASWWIYALLPWSAWSLFGNVLTPLSCMTLFFGEHLVRYWLHPEFERASIASAVRAYGSLNTGPGAAAGTSGRPSP